MTGNGVLSMEERKRRWRDFYDLTKPPTHVFRIGYWEKAIEDRPCPTPDKKQERIEWAWKVYQHQLELAQWLDDDAIPYLDVFTGTEIFAEAFGCPVHRPGDGMPFARPILDGASGVAKLKVPGVDAPCLAILFDIADELRRRAGPHAVMRLVDVQSPMDIAALIWNKTSFYTALVDAPEAVSELAHKVRCLMEAFLDAWFGRYGTDFIAHYPDYYMPCGVTLSEDEVGSVSERMFDEQFLPELRELSLRYGGIGIHCCAHARHQWNGFLRVPKLRLLNLVQDPPVLKDAYRFFGPHTAQMHSWGGDGSPAECVDQMPPGSRVVLGGGAKTRDEAMELAAIMRAKIGKS